MQNIDKKISIENLSYDTIEWVRNISLSLKVPQATLSDITDDTKQDLSKELASKLNKDVALDVSIIPVTTVTKKEAQQLSPEQKIRQVTQQYLDVLYQSKIDLVSVDYYTDTKRFAVFNLYTELQIKDKNDFRAKLYDHLQDSEDLIDIILIDWVENYTEPEKVRQQKDEDLDMIKQSFTTNFTKETTINNSDIVYVTDNDNPTRRPKILAALNITTTASSAQLSEKLEVRKWLLQQELGTQVELEVIVEYLDTLSF